MDKFITVWLQYKKKHPSADKKTFYAGAVTAVNLLDAVAAEGGVKGRGMAKAIIEDIEFNYSGS